MKTAVITGASSGLGREFVRQFYSVFPEIERVWLIARRTDRLQELAEQLEEKGLIRTERTTVTLKDGRKRNGSLLYTLLPVEQALAQHNQHQLHLAEMAAERHRAQQKLAAQNDMMRGGEVV